MGVRFSWCLVKSNKSGEFLDISGGFHISPIIKMCHYILSESPYITNYHHMSPYIIIYHHISSESPYHHESPSWGESCFLIYGFAFLDLSCPATTVDAQVGIQCKVHWLRRFRSGRPGSALGQARGQKATGCRLVLFG